MEQSVEQHVANLESRLARIESILHIKQGAAKPAAAQKNPASITPKGSQEAVYSDPQILKPGNWLGIIAVLCFVLAAGFMVKLSIESGWLTPVRQIGIAGLFGVGLIAAGFMLLEQDREYASLLPGAGVIVLYLTVLAAHNLYDLMSSTQALISAGFVSALCVWLYTQIRHDVYPITAALGAYLAPFAIGLYAEVSFTLYYYVLCSLAFAIISVWLNTRLLMMISAYLAIFMTGWVGNELSGSFLVAKVLALHFFIFSVGTYFYSRHNGTPLSRSEATGLLPVLLIFYVMEYEFISRINMHLAPWISLGFAALLLALYALARNRFDNKTQGSEFLVVAFATVACFHSGYMELLPERMGPWLFVGLMAAFAFVPMSRLPVDSKNNTYLLPKIALLAIVGIEYVNILSQLIFSPEKLFPLVALAAFAVVWAAIVVGKNQSESERQSHILLTAAHMLAICGLWQWAHGSLAVSASWLFYAVAVMAFAFKRKDEMMAKSALFVLAFAAGKALLYDAASAPTVIRILCLLLTGAVLYGCGFLMRKITHWTK